MVYILTNAKATHANQTDFQEKIATLFAGKEYTICEIPPETEYHTFFADKHPEDEFVLVGGDGTLNRFACAMGDTPIRHKIYLYKAGNGNDFLRDIYNMEAPDNTLMQVNDYLQDLPSVTVNGTDYRFINNVGFGIDGMVCTKGIEAAEKGETNINYAGIAIKCMFTCYKPCNAIVNVDGKEYAFKKVWLAPAMNGRYYGGGMKIAPEQDRKGDTISVVIFHDTGKLQTLMIFPKIFKGTHVRYKKHITVLSGHHITVTFDKPQDIQIDGEVIRDVTTYTAVKEALPAQPKELKDHETAAF